jgi:hypothetical protein
LIIAVKNMRSKIGVGLNGFRNIGTCASNN